MQRKRLKNLRKIPPYVSYNFPSLENPELHEKNSSSTEKRSIHAPAFDPKHLHIALEKMRTSERYLKRPKNFSKKFLQHLEKTGYDDIGIMVNREFYNDKDKRMKKYGSYEQSVIDYPEVIIKGKKVEEVIEDDINIESNSINFKIDITEKKPKKETKEENLEKEKRITDSKIHIEEGKQPNEDNKKLVQSEIINISEFQPNKTLPTPVKPVKIKERRRPVSRYLRQRKKINDNYAVKLKFDQRNRTFRSKSLEYAPLPDSRGDLIVNPNNPEILKFKQRVLAPHNPLLEKKRERIGRKIQSLRNKRKKRNSFEGGKFQDTSGKLYRKTNGLFKDQVKLMHFHSYWDVDPTSINNSVE